MAIISSLKGCNIVERIKGFATNFERKIWQRRCKQKLYTQKEYQEYRAACLRPKPPKNEARYVSEKQVMYEDLFNTQGTYYNPRTGNTVEYNPYHPNASYLTVRDNAGNEMITIADKNNFVDFWKLRENPKFYRKSVSNQVNVNVRTIQDSDPHLSRINGIDTYYDFKDGFRVPFKYEPSTEDPTYLGYQLGCNWG